MSRHRIIRTEFRTIWPNVACSTCPIRGKFLGASAGINLNEVKSDAVGKLCVAACGLEGLKPRAARFNRSAAVTGARRRWIDRGWVLGQIERGAVVGHFLCRAVLPSPVVERVPHDGQEPRP